MRIAHLIAERSTCYRLNVGALVVCANTRSIMGGGYNGPPTGEPHCSGHECEGALTTCTRSLHAERNAIERSNMHDSLDYDLYVTHSPCDACANLIYQKRAFIQRLFYGTEFRDLKPIDQLSKFVEVYRVTPAGYVTMHGSPSLIDPESLYGKTER